MDSNGVQGQFELNNLHSRQEERFDSLEQCIKEGFGQVSTELRAMREQGHIPIDVMNKIVDSLRPVIKYLCITIVLLVIWLTGAKSIVPGIFIDAAAIPQAHSVGSPN